MRVIELHYMLFVLLTKGIFSQVGFICKYYKITIITEIKHFCQSLV